MERTSGACEVRRHGDGDVEILGLRLGETIGTRNIVCHGQVLGDDTGVA